jgi:glycopeptide antibiotics resistance protein
VTQVNPRSFPTRRAYFALALSAIAFVLYGSLLPFELRPLPLASAWEQFRVAMVAIPLARISRSDVLANILLFVPIGFSLAGSLLLDRTRRFGIVGATPVIVAVSLGVSLFAEFLQTFSEGRVPSPLDVAAQTLGCLVGIAAWALTGARLTTWSRQTIASRGEDRLTRVLTLVAVGWLFVKLAPFDITVDLGDLAQRVRAGKIALTPLRDSGGTLAWRLWDVVAEAAGAIPLGAASLVGFNNGRHRTPAAAFAVGATLVVLVEVGHVFLRSHSAIATDAICGALGVGLGVWIATRVLPHAEQAFASPPSRVVSAPAVALCAVWYAVLCGYHWLPYDFVVDNADIRRKLARVSLLPFAGYGASSYLNALNDLLVKVSLAVPLGVAAAFVYRGPASRIQTAAWLIVGVGVFGMLEFGQLFLPTRIPDLTDVLVGAVGMYVGLRLARSLWTGG